jgi:hypothetical protein
MRLAYVGVSDSLSAFADYFAIAPRRRLEPRRHFIHDLSVPGEMASPSGRRDCQHSHSMLTTADAERPPPPWLTSSADGLTLDFR